MNRTLWMALGIQLVMGLSAGVARAECAGYDEYAYEAAFELAEIRCDLASQGWTEDGLTEEQAGGHAGMYEACMRLSVPPMVLSPAQHYDTSDGAFWRTGGAL